VPGGSGRREKGRARGEAQPTDLSDPVVQAVRPKLFGAWEMNWLASTPRTTSRCPTRKRASSPSHVPAGGDRAGTVGQPRPGQLQVHDDGEGIEHLNGARPGRPPTAASRRAEEVSHGPDFRFDLRLPRPDPHGERSETIPLDSRRDTRARGAGFRWRIAPSIDARREVR